MPRPATRVTFCQEAGRLRSLIGRAQREHLRPPSHLKALDHPGPLAITRLQQQDARAAYWCERAIESLKCAEEAWDDPPRGGTDGAATP